MSDNIGDRIGPEGDEAGIGDEEAAAKLSKEQAIAAVKESMKVLFYRDARSLDSYSIAIVTKEGIDLKEDEKLENQSWAL